MIERDNSTNYMFISIYLENNVHIMGTFLAWAPPVALWPRLSAGPGNRGMDAGEAS
jgi:hypothetical protein